MVKRKKSSHFKYQQLKWMAQVKPVQVAMVRVSLFEKMDISRCKHKGSRNLAYASI